MSFVHLHVHSEYSLLDGFSNIKKLVERAKELNMPAVALTDHGTMFGAIDFYKAATEAGIKPIIGIETYLAARSMKEKDVQQDKKSTHLLLLAENQAGYQNLLRLASIAQTEGFYYYPRVDKEFLASHAEGIICTSGCMSAEIPRLIQAEKWDEARKLMDWYYEVFGRERFYLELQQHDIPELASINKMLIDLGRRYQAKFVATNDIHYVDKDDARLQDILLAIQTGCLLADPNRMRMSSQTFYMRTPEEMSALFSEVPEAVNNTLLIAERCKIDLGFKGYHLPVFDVPEGHSAESYLRLLCEEGLQRRYGARVNDPVVRQRLDYELGIIHQMGFDTYFLIVWDLCRYARKQGIWYNARGSAAGSIVAYSLDITLVDPIDHGLIFERFLNPGRISMPDIDLDFRDDRRAEMLEYTALKYGDDKVAQIITFGTLGARAAIRDVGRVMDIPLSEVDKAAKLIPNIPGKPVTISQALEEVPDFKKLYESEDYLHELIDTASKMEGVVRNAGTHAAGVIITDRPVIDYIPLHRPTGNQGDSPIKTVSQFEMSVIESLGLLKVDFLGLATLSVMARACDLIKQRHGVEYNLNNIPTDDPGTYEMMGRGDTAGVFQVEGSGMRRWLMQMKPRTLANVIAMVALFRPGPMDFIPSYIKRFHGEEETTYRHPMLEPILKETYGITVYQEQIMFSAMKLAGYTASEADNLRKGVAKKKADVLLKHRQTFVSGAVKNGITEEVANQIFDDWEAFARYGFPKGHAADYGVIAVQTGYLKLHYPIEYMTALLSVTKNETDKVALYVADCRRMNIPVKPPDVNSSGWDFTIEDCPDETSAIRFGMGAVKNVGQGPVDAIIKARQEGGPFKDLNDFARQVDLRQVGKRALESLIRVGALDSFGTRPALLAALDRIISVSSSNFKAADAGQMSLFGLVSGVTEEIVLPKVNSEISRREILNWERELIGLYVSDHPLSPVMDTLTQAVSHFSGQLSEAMPNDKVRVAGLITRFRAHQTKTGKDMGFVTLEDLQGNIELVIFPRTWEKCREMIEVDRIIMVDGKVDLGGAEPKVLVDKIYTELKVTSSIEENPPLPDEDIRQQYYRQQTQQGPRQQQPQRPPEPPKRQADEPQAPTKPIASSLQAPSEPPPIEGDPGESDWFFIPPPPEEFPPDWDENGISDQSSVIGIKLPVDSKERSAESRAEYSVPLSAKNNAPVAASGNGVKKPAEAEKPVIADASQQQAASKPEAPVGAEGQTVEKSVMRTAPLPPPIEETQEMPELPPSVSYMVSPLSPLEGETIHMITITLRSTGDKTRDVLRMRRIYGVVSTYPGNDRFAFQVYERSRSYLVEFPNFTTGWCPELVQRLHQLVGQENVRVEPILFQ